jgi:hypothetical protein
MSAKTDVAAANAETIDTEDTTVESAGETSDAQDDACGVHEEDTAPAATAAPMHAPPAAQQSTLAEVSAQLRQEAAEITEIAAQAGRLGIAIDAAKALREGTTPDALRSLVLERASAAADARDIVAAPPSPVQSQAGESPIVAAAKRSASGAKT